eukprot:1967844-Amphidinium_carterae.1
MDVEVLTRYFQDFTVKVLDYGDVRKYPLTTRYLQHSTLEDHTSKDVAAIIVKEHKLLPLEKDGHSMDILVFLAGKKAVQEVAEELVMWKPRVHDIYILRVQGGQAVEVQESALQRAAPRGKRKIILATDVVESSVTPPAVDLVINAVKHKRRRWNSVLEESPLEEEYISKDEAKQRAGRTGRVRPGEVVSLSTAFAPESNAEDSANVWNPSCILVAKHYNEELRLHPDPAILHEPLESILLNIYDIRGLGARVLERAKMLLKHLPPNKHQTLAYEALCACGTFNTWETTLQREESSQNYDPWK